MNINHKFLNTLSDTELIRYLDLHSTDPVILRLVNILSDTQGGLISDLVAFGMDPQTWTFRADGYNEYYPGQYVNHLETEVDYYKKEADDWQFRYDESRDECKRLSARSVAQLMSEMKELVERSKAEAANETRIANKIRTENEELKDKINVWQILER